MSAETKKTSLTKKKEIQKGWAREGIVLSILAIFSLVLIKIFFDLALS